MADSRPVPSWVPQPSSSLCLCFLIPHENSNRTSGCCAVKASMHMCLEQCLTLPKFSVNVIFWWLLSWWQLSMPSLQVQSLTGTLCWTNDWNKCKWITCWRQMTSNIEKDPWFALDLVWLVIMIWYPWKLLNSEAQNRERFLLYTLSTSRYTWGFFTLPLTKRAGWFLAHLAHLSP